MATSDLLPAPENALAPVPAVESLNRLAAVLGRENAALKVRDTTCMRRLLEEKQAALVACERWLAGGEGHGGADILADDAFEALRSRLDELVSENQRRLRIAIAANQRLVESIAIAVQSQAPGSEIYASDGRTELANARRAGPPPALSVNRAL